MNMIKTKGLVLHSARYGEGAKMLTVLTEEKGKISVAAKGAASVKRGAAAMGNMCYSEFILNKRGEVYSLSEISPIETFFDISKSLEAMEAAAEMLSFANFVCRESVPEPQVLRICLNCLYALAKLNKDSKEALTVLYIKILSEIGFMPELSTCTGCGEENDGFAAFSVKNGGVLCENCINPADPHIKFKSADTVHFMRYVCECDIKDMFKFKIDEIFVREAYLCAKLFISQQLEYHIK